MIPCFLDSVRAILIFSGITFSILTRSDSSSPSKRYSSAPHMTPAVLCHHSTSYTMPLSWISFARRISSSCEEALSPLFEEPKMYLQLSFAMLSSSKMPPIAHANRAAKDRRIRARSLLLPAKEEAPWIFFRSRSADCF